MTTRRLHGAARACRVAALAAALALALVVPARADLLSLLGHAGEGAAHVGEMQAAAAARAPADLARGISGGAKRAAVEMAASGGFRVVAEDGSLLAAFRPEEGQAAALLALTDRQIAIPERLLAKRPDMVRFLLAQPQLHAAVLTDEGLWPLRLAKVGEQEAILVSASPTLSLAADAFARRSALERLAAAPLVRRMRVIPLISNEDPVALAAFRDGVAQVVDPPASRDAALKLLGQSRENLLVVTGHVEGEAFVVRTLTGEEQFRVPVADIYRAAEAARSEVLLLGCRVACATRHSGPLQDVTADAVIAALAAVDPNANALTFLKQLSDKTGPLLIQDDHSGGFLVIDDADARSSDRKWSVGSVPVRFAMKTGGQDSNALVVATDGIDTAGLLLAILVACVLMPVMGWAMLILGLGVGPKRAWRTIEELRSNSLGVEYAQAPIPDRAVLLYLALGPWALIIHAIVFWGAIVLLIVLLVACTPGGVATAALALLGTVVARKRWTLLLATERPGFISLFLIMGVPLLVAAALSGTLSALLISPDLLGTASSDAQNFTKQTVPAGIGIFAACAVYALALWRRFTRLLAICARTTQILLGWPGLFLVWVETRVLRVGRRRVT